MGLLNSSTQIYANDTSGIGTVGGFFKLNDGDVYGITNNHVIANANDCNIGDAVYRYGGDHEVIGTLHYWVSLDPKMSISWMSPYSRSKMAWTLGGSWLMVPRCRRNWQQQ